MTNKQTPTRKQRLLQLAREISKLYDEQRRLEAEQKDERNSSVVGRCFKYHNSRSGLERWWMYSSVVEVKDGSLVAFSFQTDSDGKTEIEPENRIHSDSFAGCSGYKEITREEFEEQWALTLTALQNARRV